MRKKLPSKARRVSDISLATSHLQGWAAMVQCVVKAAVSVAEIMYPCDHQQLVNAAAAKTLGKSSADKYVTAHASGSQQLRCSSCCNTCPSTLKLFHFV